MKNYSVTGGPVGMAVRLLTAFMLLMVVDSVYPANGKVSLPAGAKTNASPTTDARGAP